jgi:SAM-dependent methyltransferase
VLSTPDVVPVVDPREIVAAAFDAVAERYAGLEQEEWPRLRWLRDLLDRLPAESAVLDLGCGNGLPAAPEVRARGHAYVGVDVSARQIDLARAATPAATFVHADMGAVDFPESAFDAVVCFYAIGCIPRAEHEALLRRVHRWLRPGGWLLTAEEDRDLADAVGEWLDVPMFGSGFDAAGQRKLTEACGFAIERTAVETQVEGGTAIPFVWILARRLG